MKIEGTHDSTKFCCKLEQTNWMIIVLNEYIYTHIYYIHKSKYIFIIYILYYYICVCVYLYIFTLYIWT